MTLTLQYRGETNIPVEIDGIVPDRLRELSLAEIERLEIFHGNEKPRLGDFFQVSGDPTDERLELTGELAGVHWIGTRMVSGEIHVAGTAGRHLGSEMAGGTIHVEGDAGDWVGGEMHGGFIQIKGRAGHLIGAAYRGSATGMTGGTILIHGKAGNEIGHTMRRGLIAIGAESGDLAGFNMLAGSVLLFGNSGIRPGAGMRRGTIGLFGEERTKLLPTFRHACCYQPTVLKLLFQQLAAWKFPLPDRVLDAAFDLYSGDHLAYGKGEILMVA
jgi:formylmethanofuran dehydrogenase subunit C